jgi:hypothetical protein
MKIALCTTTIHVPHALKLLRKCSADVRFFVAGDHKTPNATYELQREIPDYYAFLDVAVWKCSEAIGWNTLARRNIAFLEALKWGADVIYSWDDDNLCVDQFHFSNIERLFDGFAFRYVIGKTEPVREVFLRRFDGIQVGGHDWFDPGSLLIPHTRHRGFPISIPHRTKAEPVTDVKIGVAAGLVIGDPDIDAVTRMEHRPDIGQVHLFGQTGVVVDPHTWTVFNSQNTALIRELIPSWFMMPNVGRHDDIYASLIVQRVARERNLYVHFGPPFTYQQRHQHDLLKDLRAEIYGMEHVLSLAALLDAIILPGKSVIEDTRIIYRQLLHCEFLPRKSVEAGLLWLEDIKSVL